MLMKKVPLFPKSAKKDTRMNVVPPLPWSKTAPSISTIPGSNHLIIQWYEITYMYMCRKKEVQCASYSVI